MGDETVAVGDVNDTKFADPTGNYGAAMKQFERAFIGADGKFDANKAFATFQGQVPGMTNMVAGATGPLSQMLNAQAAKSARLGGEAALAAMGGPNSGAGQRSFSDAYSERFTEAATQTQQAQLGLLSPLLQQSLQGQYGLMEQGLGNYGNMAGKQGDLWNPTYVTKKSPFSYAMQGLGAVGGAMGLMGGNPLATFLSGLFDGGGGGNGGGIGLNQGGYSHAYDNPYSSRGTSI